METLYHPDSFMGLHNTVEEESIQHSTSKRHLSGTWQEGTWGLLPHVQPSPVAAACWAMASLNP